MLTEFATAVSGVVAVMFGIFLGREGGYHGGDYILHQVMGIVAVFGIIIACFLRVGWMMTDRGAWLDGFRFFLFASAGVLGLGAHFGGNISHGDKFLTEYAPPMMAKPMEGLELWLKSFVEPKKKTEDNPKPPVSAGSSATKHVFNDLILPVLEAKCNKCHNEAKSKGELRMDTYELAMKGGENGKNFVPGKPEDSLSIQRINLAEDEDDHMPPQGKDQLTKEEIALITWWIKEGASDQLKVNDMELKAILGSGTKS